MKIPIIAAVIVCALTVACHKAENQSNSAAAEKADKELQEMEEAFKTRHATIIAARHGITVDVVRRVILAHNKKQERDAEEESARIDARKFSISEIVAPDVGPLMQELAAREGISVQMVAEILYDAAVFGCEDRNEN